MVLLKVLLMNACPLTMFFLSLRRGLRAAGWRVLVAMRRNSSGGIWCAGSLSGARVGAGLRRGQDQRGGDGAPGSAALLLARDGALGALASTCVGLGALPVHRQAAAMPQALVAADLHLAADVGRDLAPQITLGAVVLLDVIAQLDELLVGQLAHALVTGDAGRGDRLLGAGAPHSEDVRQGDFDALLARKVDSHQTCHVQFSYMSRRPDPTPRRTGISPRAPQPRPAGGRLAPVASSLHLCGARGAGGAVTGTAMSRQNRDRRGDPLSPGAACDGDSSR